MSRFLQADCLLKVVAGLLLALLVWQGKTMCDRVSALERNQIRIMVCLGIEPVASESWNSLKISVPQTLMAKQLTNRDNQSSEKNTSGH